MTEYIDRTHSGDLTFAAVLARIEAAPAAPESYVRQHRSEADCWCGPIQVGTLGVWTHQMGDDQ